MRLALTHPSVAREHGTASETNQRLEFLGDAVLQLVLTRELYEKYPASEEGPLSKARAKLVNGRALAACAKNLGLGACLLLSRGEEMSGGRDRVSNLADAFEALMGALYLDGGLPVAARFILGEFAAAFSGLETIPSVENPKGELQELLQARATEAPGYRVLSATGPDHNRVFVCTVNYGGQEIGRGSGKSKKAAESEAAHNALARWRAGEIQPPAGEPGGS